MQTILKYGIACYQKRLPGNEPGREEEMMEQKIGMDVGTKFLNVTEQEKSGNAEEIIQNQREAKYDKIKMCVGQENAVKDR